MCSEAQAIQKGTLRSFNTRASDAVRLTDEPPAIFIVSSQQRSHRLAKTCGLVRLLSLELAAPGGCADLCGSLRVLRLGCSLAPAPAAQPGPAAGARAGRPPSTKVSASRVSVSSASEAARKWCEEARKRKAKAVVPLRRRKTSAAQREREQSNREQHRPHRSAIAPRPSGVGLCRDGRTGPGRLPKKLSLSARVFIQAQASCEIVRLMDSGFSREAVFEAAKAQPGLCVQIVLFREPCLGEATHRSRPSKPGKT